MSCIVRTGDLLYVVSYNSVFLSVEELGIGIAICTPEKLSQLKATSHDTCLDELNLPFYKRLAINLILEVRPASSYLQLIRIESN